MASGGIENLKGKAPILANRPGTVEVLHKVTFGATGAPTNEGGNGVTFARTEQGKYTATFDKKFVELRGYQGCPLSATPDSWSWQALSYTQSTGVLVLWFVDEAGAAQDPISGDVHHFTFKMRNTLVR